ncbi:GGDEF domain-containing protein [Pseudomaricurvus alcaniphilus]|nr:GGDEF domain-containing protein [Pseudomaricurvus alcaniphilus]NHN37679.1 GGDEF domain-containing protein [Pseudomaricurvus alcaniphilus]
MKKLRRKVKRLDEQVHQDTLTGLFNFRHFSEALDHEIERTQRSGNATGLIMLDLDHFKAVNDTYGHEIGNQVLAHIAQLLQKTTRKLDIPCRYGGEEFAVILPSTDLLTSSQVAERLRYLIETSPLPLEQGNIQLSASLGVDVYTHGRRQTQEEFVQRVDALLYQAKRSGRNRVCAGKRHELEQAVTVSTAEKDALHGLFRDSSERTKNDQDKDR